MAEPKKRATSTRSGNRRSHLAPKAKPLSNCPKCQTAIMPHRVCYECGHYKGENVLELAKKEREKEERRKAKEKENE